MEDINKPQLNFKTLTTEWCTEKEITLIGSTTAANPVLNYHCSQVCGNHRAIPVAAKVKYISAPWAKEEAFAEGRNEKQAKTIIDVHHKSTKMT